MQSVTLLKMFFFLVIPFQILVSFLFSAAFIHSDSGSLWSLFSVQILLLGALLYLQPAAVLPLFFSANHHLILPSSMATIFQKEGNPFIPLQVQSIQAPVLCFSSVFPCGFVLFPEAAVQTSLHL